MSMSMSMRSRWFDMFVLNRNMSVQDFIINNMVMILHENGYKVLDTRFNSMKWNVILIEKNDQKFVAKYIFHKTAYETEYAVYKLLQKENWWTVKMIDRFVTYVTGRHSCMIRMFVLTYFPDTISWNDRLIDTISLDQLTKQLNFLHKNGLYHTDCGLYNVLLNTNGNVALIDFERVVKNNYTPFDDFYRFYLNFFDPKVTINLINRKMIHSFLVNKFDKIDYQNRDKYRLMYVFEISIIEATEATEVTEVTEVTTPTTEIPTPTEIPTEVTAEIPIPVEIVLTKEEKQIWYFSEDSDEEIVNETVTLSQLTEPTPIIHKIEHDVFFDEVLFVSAPPKKQPQPKRIKKTPVFLCFT